MITDPREYVLYIKDIQNSETTSYVTLPLTEPRFVIDANSRTINIPSKFNFLATKYDHCAETVYFEIDRYFDDVDLSKKTCIIQYLNKDENKNYYEGMYRAKHMDIESIDGKIIFEWSIENTATRLAGDIAFCVRFFSIDEHDNFTYNFNTIPAHSIIMDTLSSIETDDYMDVSVLEKWISKIDTLATKMVHAEAIRLENEEARNFAEQERVVAEIQRKIDSENAIKRVFDETDDIIIKANNAAKNADAARDRLENVTINVETLPEKSEAFGSLEKTDTGMIFNFSIPTGDRGAKGDTGEGFKVLDYFNTLNDLKTAVPNPETGVVYGVGSDGNYDIYIYGETSGWVNNGKLQGAKGEDGATFTPKVSSNGILSWTNNKDLENPASVNIKGNQGVTFIPSINDDGVLSWTNDGKLENPDDLLIKGYTPQKGTDYWTNEDKDEIIEETLDLMSIRKLDITVLPSDWVESTIHEQYRYECSIPINGATADMLPEVCFSFADAISGNFAPVAESSTNSVVIYARYLPITNVVISSVTLWKWGESV